MIEKIVENARRAISADTPDYIGEDGLLYCGKCHTRKQCRPGGFFGDDVLPCLCRCETEREEQVKKTQQQREFELRTEQLDEQFGTAGPDRSAVFSADCGNSSAGAVCRRYAERFDSMRQEGIGLLLYGAVGTGKSFYANCIVNELRGKGIPATVFSVNTLLNAYSESRDKNVWADTLCKRYSLLVLDDLGSERCTEFRQEQLFTLTDAWYRTKKPLIVTTNLTPEELKAPATEQLARIYNRITERCAVPLRLNGTDFRTANAAEARARARELLLN